MAIRFKKLNIIFLKLIMKKYIPLFLFFSVAINAQILDRFPQYQVPYIGGYANYYKDFHEIVIEKNMKPCSNKGETYEFRVLINEDHSISFIKDYNSGYIDRNKCAYELAREVAKHQTNWNAAKVDGFPKAAVASFIVFPDDLFDRYQEGYVPQITYPTYGNYEGGGAKEFRNGITNRIDTRRFDWNDRFNVIVEFIITKDSKIENILMIKSSSHEELDKQIVFGIKSTKKLWKPATINGQPVDYRYRLQLNAVTDPL